MMLFPKALFLATTFPKIYKNSIFLMNFYLKNFKIFQQFVFFVQTREKLTQGFEIFCKIGENTAFLQFSYEIILQIFNNSPAFGGLSPQDPLQGRPQP